MESFRELILSRLEIPGDGRILIAFSGGSDSLCLLSILSSVCPSRIAALYVDHGIRGRDELDREIALNSANAVLLGAQLSIHALEEGEVSRLADAKGIGTEAAARELRYKALNEHASRFGFSYIATAHHREDQAETLLMRISSGAPFYAYQGIREKERNIIRPLLSVPKKWIDGYLEEEGLVWSYDSTNSDTDYERNRIRRFLMPSISESEREMLSSIARNVATIRRMHKPLSVNLGLYASIDRAEYLGSVPFAREEALYRINRAFGNRERLSRAFISEIGKKAEAGSGRILSPYFSLYFTKECIKAYPLMRAFAYAYGEHGWKYDVISEARDERTLLIDSSLLAPPAAVRSSLPGDRIELKDGWKRISDLEKEYRIPYSVVVEDRNGIVAMLARELGGRDRLSRRFLGSGSLPIALAP